MSTNFVVKKCGNLNKILHCQAVYARGINRLLQVHNIWH